MYLLYTYVLVRLSLSIGLWLTVAVLIVLGGHGWVQLREEEADLDAAARRELAYVTTAIRSAVENAIRDKQEPDVAELLEQLELKDPAVDVFVIGARGESLGSSWGASSNLAKVRELLRVRPQDGSGVEELASGELAMIAPLQIGGATTGRLVVIRPLNALQGDLHEERRAVGLSVGLLIAALLLVIWVVVRLQVHLPMDRIIAGVRQIRGGDLTARIGLTGSNEFAELAREFDAMTASLEQARYELASAAEAREKLELEMQRANRMAIVGEVAATLAHEIGSPLQVLNGRARDLAARSDLPADVSRSAAILVEQTDRVHHIVERLLDAARRKAPEVVAFDVADSVQRMVELVSSQARRMGVRLELDCSDVPLLQGDPAQVQQVVLNLLQNALRASERGQVVQITVARSSFTRLADSRPQPSVAITVDDAGRGIPEHIREHVFEPFFTAWEGERRSRGTGLGLAVVKSIVKDHGGIVSAATPASGVGARFIVHFPVRARHAERAR
jgi:signal transduction histidine kinase